MTAKDYFAKAANEEKPPFSRQQFGGSIGGPILRNRMFFFGAVEQIYEDLQEPVGERQFDELELLVSATAAGRLPPGLVNPNHPRFAPTGGELTLSSVKVNGQLSNNHSLMGRFAHQRDDRDAVTFTSDNDLREPENGTIRMWSAVGQHGWVLGNRGLNQITAQVNHLYRLSDVVSNITGEHYTRDFPNVDIFPPRLAFPSVNTGAGGAGGSLTDTYVIQFKDDVSLISGNHTMKFGGTSTISPTSEPERERALRHADVLRRSVGHPEQQQRPVSAGLRRRRGSSGSGSRPTAVPSTAWARGRFATDAKQVRGWFQDDWRATSRLTLNLGVRYDVDFHFYDQKNYENNATRLVLEAIGHPYAALPKTPTKDISPRVGFAYDLSGDGRRVLRGGYGIYFDQFNTGAAGGDITFLNSRPLNALATLTNTAIGVGQLATFRFGVDPLPPQPTEGNSLPRGSAGQWMDPNMTDPRTHQAHVGYAHTLAENTTLAVDYTHVDGRKELRQLNLNPIVNGQRAAGAGLHPRVRDSERPERDQREVGRSTSRATTR